MYGGFSGTVGAAGWAVLLGGFAYAAWVDLRTREAPDELWLVLGLAGFVLGLVAFSDAGTIALVSWGLVGGLVVQHFLPWDRALERRAAWLPGIVELVGYAVVTAILLGLSYRDGLGTAGGVPSAAVAALVAVLLARGLFELGLLYGGADAKALIAAAVLLPLDPPVLASVPLGAARLAAVIPGPLTILMNAALLSAAVPLVVAARNLRRHEFEGSAAFLGYQIPVRELPDHFVWLRDPVFGTPTPEEEEVETSADDRALRVRQRDQLLAQGVERVWVTPQIPFLVFFFAGALAAAIAGNLLFDLIGIL